jgi:oligoendopeptidase F
MPSKARKTKTNVKNVLWDLSPLYTGQDDPKLERDFRAIERGCRNFGKNYRGQIKKLDAKGLLKALRDLEKIEKITYRVFIYASLEFSTKSNDPAWGAFLQKVQERYTAAAVDLEFFKVEWAKLSQAKVKQFIGEKILARYRHFLEHTRLFRKHTLNESEEILASKLSQVGTGAWVRYYSSVLADVTYELRGKKITAAELTAKVQDEDRALRRDAVDARIKGLMGVEKPLTFAFNMILAGSKVQDETRSYDHWVQQRNMTNEIPDDVVDALVEVCLERSDILRRYMKLKNKLLGVKPMMSYDVWAPLPGAKKSRTDWDKAVVMVNDLFEETRPSFGEISRNMFKMNRVDAGPRKGKRSGAFCMPNMDDLPFVMLNWTGKPRDVATLAHEFGHAVHMELSRKQGPMGSCESLVMAEVASVFMETLLYNKLLAKTKQPRQRLDMLKQVIEDGFATTLRQMQFNRFENNVHNHRREQGELSREEFSGYFAEAEKAYFGNTVKPYKDTENFWMYITHFMNVPGYVYAYCASYLVVLALYARYLEEGDKFLVGYEKMLAAGGSKSPADLLAAMGIDWSKPEFWHGGLDVLSSYVDQFQATAKELKLL